MSIQGQLFEANVSPCQKIELRDYQQRAVDGLRASFGMGKRSPLLQAPTGAGKTVMAAFIASGAVAKGNRVLFLAPFLDLLEQTKATFDAFGIPATIWHRDHPLDQEAPVVIATPQTLERRIEARDRAKERGYPYWDFIPTYDLAVYDEAHAMRATIAKIMQVDGKKWIGLSATPWTDGLGLLFDELIKPTSLAELVDLGVLSEFHVFAPSTPDLSKVRKAQNDVGYHTGDLEDVMGGADIMGDVVRTWIEKCNGRPTVAFGVNRAHAKMIQREFLDAGIAAGYIDAHTKGDERSGLIRSFKNGEITILCNCRTLTTGFDAPVSCIIDAAPTRSAKLHVQKIGRGLRINPGTEDCVILDHAGNTLRLGLVTDIDKPSLSEKSKAEPSEARPAEALPKPCPACNFVKAAKVHQCPNCGFKPEAQSAVSVGDGELVELSVKRGQPTLFDKQEFFSQVLRIARDRHRSEGWAAHTYRKKFGVWPRGLRKVPSDIVTAEVSKYVKSLDIAYVKSLEARS
jgi:superfamily II DNA or RNA helicase